MKKLTAIVLAMMMMVSSFAGCSQNQENATPETQPPQETSSAEAGQGAVPSDEPHGSFNYYMISDVDTINPHTWLSGTSGSLISMCTYGLYRFAPNETGDGFIFTTELAESDPVQVDEEGKRWQIKILENAKWQNGDPITIDDVIYSWKMCLDPILINSRASQLASDYITIVNAKEYSLQANSNTVKWEDVGIKKVDDYTLEIICTDPVTAVDVKNHINYDWNNLVHEETYEACMNEDRTLSSYGTAADKFMSCGQFILKEWIPGAQITLARNPDYVLAEETKMENFVFRVVGDSNTALELFLNGELDAVNLSADSIEQYIEDPRVYQSPASGVNTMLINMGNTNNNGILGDVNFRKALYYAVDRESIAKMVNGIPANWTVPLKCIADVESGVMYRDMEESNAYIPENLGYDPAKAKELYDAAMQKAGLSNLTLTLMYSETSTSYKKISEFLQKTLPEVFGDSFKLELNAVSGSVSTEYIRGWRNGDQNSFELAWFSWNTNPAAPWNGLKVYSGTYSNKNEPYFNDEYDALWQEANFGLEAKLDNAYRLELTRKMEEITIEDAVTIPIYEMPAYTMIADRVQLPVKEYVPVFGFGYTLASIVE